MKESPVPYFYKLEKSNSIHPVLREYRKKHDTLKKAPKLIKLLARYQPYRKLYKIKLFGIRKLWPRLVAPEIYPTSVTEKPFNIEGKA